LSKQANDLGLAIDDHLIIGYRSITSMRNRGFI
jgi:DNA repair protein RadC